MADRQLLIHWRFSLRQLFLATTTSAMAFAVIVSDLPVGLRTFAICVPVFWFGWAVVFVGAGLARARGMGLQLLGGIIMGFGFTVAFLPLVASFAISLLWFMTLAMEYANGR